jgi:hypothetical protein
MSQIENSKRASCQAVHFRDLEIWILNLFRISRFELRISENKPDHFVDFLASKRTQETGACWRGVSGEQADSANFSCAFPRITLEPTPVVRVEL